MTTGCKPDDEERGDVNYRWTMKGGSQIEAEVQVAEWVKPRNDKEMNNEKL